MSGPGFAEFLLLLMIGLVVLGPKRLPQVAAQIGTWVGQARRMTRQLRRQLEEEVDFEKNFGIDPKDMHIPLDDDTYSPVHDADAGADPEERAAEPPPAKDAETPK
ncbi:MAG: Sec-independent protein translocase protein TatB [Woeseiaceae bacterium]|nr:Sec-independent protein translocase protein TatB [Woeseiaceae bacterium]